MRRKIAIVAALVAAMAPLTAAHAAGPERAPAAVKLAGDPTRTPATPSYTVSLTSNTSGTTWTGHESVTFTNAAADPLNEIYLRLWDNYHGSCPSTPITVTNVTGGTAGALTVGCTALKITLPAPLAQGAQGTIGFDLSIVVPSGADRFGHDGSYNFIGNALPVLAVHDGAGWHLDPYTNNGESFYSLASDFNVTLDHPTSLKVPATGTSVDRAGSLGPYDHDRDRLEGTRLRLGGRAVQRGLRHLVRGREGQRLPGEQHLLQLGQLDAEHLEGGAGRAQRAVRRLPVR